MTNFFTRLLGAAAPAHEMKDSRAAKLLAMHALGLPQWTSRNAAAMTREGYERNAVCHRCVRMVAEAAASVPWLVYEGREEIDDHPLLALIERPNPADTSVSFIEALCANLLLHGNAYIEQVSLDGAPRELYALRPDRMSIEAGRNGWPAAFIYRTPGGEARYDMTGDGVNKPKGFLAYTTVADASWSWNNIGYIATGAAGAFAATNPSDTLFNLVYTLRAGYRQNARFVMGRRAQSLVRQFKTTTGDYLWAPPASADGAATLMNFPVVEAEDMPDPAANSLSIAFGDFERGYLIVDRIGVRVLRDPYSAKPYVLFYTTKRVGGGVQNFEAIKLLKFAAS